MIRKTVLRAATLALSLSAALVLSACAKSGTSAAAPTTQTPTETVMPTIAENVVQFQGETYRLREDLQTILILGLDKFEREEQTIAYTNKMQSDFLVLAIIDEKANTCSLLHLNRDTMTEIPRLGLGGAGAGSFVGQLALAHTYGSGGSDSSLNAVKAVSNLLGGVKIDHYMTLTMDAVGKINDLVGGVTVEVLDDFSGIDDSLMQRETVTLKGQQALTYVRSRGGLEDSSNLHRMERQRQYLAALQQQLKAAVQQEDGFTLDALLQLNEYMVSDCTVNQLSDLGDSLAAYQVGDILTTPGDAQEGEEFMEFTVDEDALQQLVMDVFYEPVEES